MKHWKKLKVTFFFSESCQTTSHGFVDSEPCINEAMDTGAVDKGLGLLCLIRNILNTQYNPNLR